MASYIVMTGNGDQICDGVSEYEIERVAQAWADRLAETVYYCESGNANLDSEDDDDDPELLFLFLEDMSIAVKPRTMTPEN